MACSSENSALVVPENRNYHLKPITFSGPCQPDFTMKVSFMHACIYNRNYHLKVNYILRVLQIWFYTKVFYSNTQTMYICMYVYVTAHIRLLLRKLTSFCFCFFTRSMEQSKLLLINQIMKKIHYIGLCLIISKILQLKVVAQSMAMGGNGGKAHAKSTQTLYVHGWTKCFYLIFFTT